MGEGEIDQEFKRCIEKGKLRKFPKGKRFFQKELKTAEEDLEEAKGNYKNKKFKWATIQGYYCMFHSARALLYSRGFREKSHYALLIAIRELFGSELGRSLIDKFEEGMDLRQEADYGLKFSDVGAVEVVESAEAFLKKVCQILKVA